MPHVSQTFEDLLLSVSSLIVCCELGALGEGDGVILLMRSPERAHPFVSLGEGILRQIALFTNPRALVLSFSGCPSFSSFLFSPLLSLSSYSSFLSLSLSLSLSQDADLSDLSTRLSSIDSILGPSASGLITLITQHLKMSESRSASNLLTLSSEIEHKFGLQVAENKRMTQHLSGLKRENQALGKRVVALEDRVCTLELELGGDDE
jgi:hypothetical protein